MYKKVMVFYLAVLVSHASAQCKTPWKDCGSTYLKIDNVIIPNCCGPPCILHKGTNATVSIVFEVKKQFDSLEQKLCGEFSGVCIGLPGLPKDVCQFVSCPLKPGQQYAANVTLPVDKDYPGVTVTGKWTFYSPNDTKNDIGCFEVPLRITA